MRLLPKLSIIVPVYKVQYLSRCIESILNQSYKNIELILINDGSPHSVEQVWNLYKDDQRVKFITQHNQGTSAARNNGLKQATGEFICFADDDDYLERDILSKAMEVFCHENIDIVAFNVRIMYGRKQGKILGWKENIKDRNDIIQSIFAKECWGVWGKIYRKNVWEKIFFNKKIFGCEDLEVMYYILCMKPQIFILPLVGYNYECDQHNSITQDETSLFDYNMYITWQKYFHNSQLFNDVKLEEYFRLNMIKNLIKCIYKEEKDNKLSLLQKKNIENIDLTTYGYNSRISIFDIELLTYDVCRVGMSINRLPTLTEYRRFARAIIHAYSIYCVQDNFAYERFIEIKKYAISILKHKIELPIGQRFLLNCIKFGVNYPLKFEYKKIENKNSNFTSEV